ncbi:hypothetical protein [Devosia sp. SL43]|uniref:hypothetical protein n=1 Tax=Devosia sp. SL43 TaxID=2806348 RepID=UPI001F47588D|nr:hypothetical protein [Devosia sp. SL43]UJW84023.1 hypothetical protein IM737_11185 [Devosia sp. SL43]
MSNALGIGPAVMINRIADRQGTPAGALLGKVAELRMDLQVALEDEQAKAADLSPTGEADATVVSSGAVVDRLI